jgi:hypothetical protein
MFPGMTYQEWLVARFLPVMGREDADEPTPEKVKESHPDWSDEQVTAEIERLKAASSDDDDDDDDDDDHDGDDPKVADLTSKLAESERKLHAAEQAARKAKDDARKARSQTALDTDNWEQLAKERETEVADLREQLDTATKRADDAESGLSSFQKQVRVVGIASRLGFRDPTDAQLHISGDDAGDDKTAERALRDLAKKKPYLIDERKATGRAMNGGSNGGPLTVDQMKKMTPEQINASWAQVQESLSSGG